MSWDLVANVAVAGVLTGLVYGLMALGLSVIFGVVRVVNFAHGEMMTIAMYAAAALFAAWGVDPFLAMLPVAAAFFVLGYALQAGFINPFITRPEHSQFMLLVAVAIIMVNALLMTFGPDARNVQVDYQLESFQAGPLLFDKARLYAAGAAVLAAAALFAFFKFSLVGKAIRACADNYFGAKVVGLNVKHLYALTFGLGSACVAIAGCAMVLLVDVTPPLGPYYTLLAFVIVIVGGLGSMGGALLGGIVIGLTESLAGLFCAPSAKSMVSFGLLILVLVLKPQGFLGGGQSVSRGILVALGLVLAVLPSAAFVCHPKIEWTSKAQGLVAALLAAVIVYAILRVLRQRGRPLERSKSS
ncbi:MAG: branched-chain amino acid ABC transporter permease [Betaproteobacteria bacterium]